MILILGEAVNSDMIEICGGHGKQLPRPPKICPKDIPMEVLLTESSDHNVFYLSSVTYENVVKIHY